MGRINGVNQNQMLRSDLELNQDDNSKKVMSTRTAAVAVQYTKDHIDNISHGFKRFVLCVFTLGINELLRSKYARDYEANITKMSDDIGKIHSALKEEVGERQLKDLDAEIKHEKLYGIDHRFEYKEHTTELKLSMGNVTLTRHVNGNGTLRFADGSEENISNCANVRQRLEIDVMKNAKIFRKSLVMQILNEYRDKITSNEVPNSAKASLKEQGTIVLKAIQDVKMPETNATIRAAARNRLNELLGILFKDNLNLSEETTATLDPNFGVQMAEKLLNGELDSPETFKEFLNRGISGTNLGTDEATKLAAKLEKAQDEYNKYQQADFPTRLRMEAEPPNPASLVSFAEQYVDRKPTESLPQGESREVHDFAAEIILSEDITKYDNALEQGHLTGARLAKIFKKNYELVGRMMANRLEIKENKEISDMLATVEPSLAGKISEILDKLNDDFASEKKKNEEEIENTKKALEEEKNSDIYCKEEKERRINKKEKKLNKLLKEKTTKEAKSSAEQRADFVMHYLKNISKIQHGIAYKMGAKFVEDINPQEMAYRSEQVTEGYVIVEEEKDQWNNVKYTDLRHLDELSKKLRKTYSSLTSLAFLWVNEGLFGSGFSHDDLHTANLMLNGDKLVIIDYGNCMQLTSAERTNVISAVCGVAVCDVDIFIKGFRNMLSPESVALFDRNRDAIKERLSIIFSAKNKGLDKTAQRLDVALKLFQKDYKIEVPPQIHNFLEGQTRLQNAMTQNLQLIEQINELRNQYATAFGNKELSEDEKTIIANSAELTEEQKGDKLPSMMKCLTDVVKNNINAKLLNAIGLKNAKSVYNSIKDELVKIKG